MLASGVKDAAALRLNSRHVEVLVAHFIQPYAGWIIAPVQCRLGDIETRQMVEALIAGSQVDIVRIGLGPQPSLA
jgi:hypothetical protein